MEIVGLPSKDGNEFLRNTHYLGRAAVGTRFYGLLLANKLVGVAGFRCNELCRFVIDNGLPKNTASEFLSICLKKVGRDYIFTFADEDVGHLGVLYQACNALYLGKVGDGISYEVDGVLYSGKFVEKKIRDFVLAGKEVRVVPSKGKHKYVFITAKDKNRRKILSDEFLKKSFPFPKANI